MSNMDETRTIVQLHATGVLVAGATGPLVRAESYELTVDASGVTLSGGEPVAAWQIPFTAMTNTTVHRSGDIVVMGAWVAGSYVTFSIPEAQLTGGSAQDLEVLVATAAGRAPLMLRKEPKSSRKKWWGFGIVGVVILAIVVVSLVVTTRSQNTAKPTAAQRAATASRNLALSDLPASWGIDDPTTAPLAGLLETGSSTKPTPAEKAMQRAIVSAYQACMGVSNEKDRVFGAAGVTPPIQISSSPIGYLDGSTYLEVGTSTQRYVSSQSVQADLVQLRSEKFPQCFAEAIGRMSSASTTTQNPTPTLEVSPQHLPQVLGVFTAGSNVTIAVPDGTGSTVPAELGVSILVTGNYEQTLYTFATPGSFPPALRNQLVQVLGARLLGTNNSSAI